MSNEDYKGPVITSRRIIATGIGLSVLLVALVAATLVTRQDSIGVMDSTPSPSSSEVTTSTGLDTRIGSRRTSEGHTKNS